jgi:ATP-dependent DNA helicase DinG
MHESEWLELFPFQTPREQQVSAINSAISAIKAGKRFIICDLPTGVGKSNIGITLARWAANHIPIAEEGPKLGGTFLTTQRTLQDQYIKDFDNVGMKNLVSSSNYTCTHNGEADCASAWKLQQLSSNSGWQAACKGLNCHYRCDKKIFNESQLAITNFAYFLQEVAHVNSIPKRQILVIDEAHNIEKSLMSFVEVSINQSFVEQELGMDFPKYKTACQGLTSWVMNEYYEQLRMVTQIKIAQAEELEEYAKNNEEVQKLIKSLRAFENNWFKMKTLKDNWDEDNWVVDISSRQFRGKEHKVITFKTIDVSRFAERMLFKKGEVVVCLSATIINGPAFCKSVGIPISQAHFISEGSPFPANNRPIFYSPVGKMSRDNIDATLPGVVENIKYMLEELHPNEKGIIHCHTYKISNYIQNMIDSDRLLFHTPETREETLNKHTNSKEPTILVSPSMAEGVDLKDDLSRWQVIVKVPYPYMGDKQVKKKMEKDRDWYPYETAKTIIQAVGRSVRSMEDHAVTYILDESWSGFYYRSNYLFPDWFKEAYVEVR